MATKKIRLRPQGSNNYADILHPETSADIVIENDNKQFVSAEDKVSWGGKVAMAFFNDRVKTPVPANAKFTDTIVDISGKADKTYVDGKVKTDVPLGALFTDTVYTLPSTLPSTMITDTSAKRFVTDAEKSGWNGKWTYSEATIKAVKVNNAIDADTVNGKTVAVNVPTGAKFTDTIVDISGKADKTQVLTNVPANAKFTDTLYTLPSTLPSTMITDNETKRFVTDTEKTAWGNKWNYSEATIKAVKVTNAVNADNADTVNNKTVAVNVPSNAKFTDTVPTKTNVETALGYKVVFYTEGDTIPTLPANTIAFIKEV